MARIYPKHGPSPHKASDCNQGRATRRRIEADGWRHHRIYGGLYKSRGPALAGCDVADSVTKKTTILVVGDQDLRYTRGQEKSTKHRKAEHMIAKGAPIRIVGESDFLLMVRA